MPRKTKKQFSVPGYTTDPPSIGSELNDSVLSKPKLVDLQEELTGNNPVPKRSKNVDYWNLPENTLFGLFDPLDKDNQARHNSFISIMFKWLPLAKAFFRIFLEKEAQSSMNLDNLVVKDSIFTQEDQLKEYRGDILFQTTAYIDSQKPVETITNIGLLLEHKAQKDYFVIRQAKKYIDLFHESEEATARREGRFKKGFQFTIIVPVVLYQGSGRFCGPVRYRDLFPKVKGLEEYVPDFLMGLVDVNAITAERLEKSKNIPELWFVLRILKAIFLSDPEREICQIFVDLQPFLVSEEFGKRYQAFTRLLVEYIMYSARKEKLIQIQETIQKSLSQGKPIMDTIADVIFDRGRKAGREEEKQAMKTIADEFFDKGRKAGKLEGKLEGRFDEKVNSIVRILQSKKIKTPVRLRKVLSGIRDEIVLDSLFQSALFCSSLAEFEENLL